jgi:heptosyltransferase-2
VALKQPTNSILVIRGGAIGDFILTLPVLAALRRQFPTSRLELLGYPHIARLALAGGLVDAVRPIEAQAMAGFFVPGGVLEPALADYFAGFALIISFLYDPDRIFQNNVAQCSRAQFIAGPHRPDDGSGRHATEVLLKPLEQLAIFNPDPVPRLRIGKRSYPEPFAPETTRLPQPKPGMNQSAQASPQPRLALHPGSGSERKNWAEPNWAALLRRLVAETRLQFLLVGGEAEGGRLDRLAPLVPADRLQIARSLPLTELAVHLEDCAAFVGHDSGITHLAAALGLAGLVLWGDSAEAVWRPRSDRMRLVREPGGLAALTVDRVWKELGQVIDLAQGSF